MFQMITHFVSWQILRASIKTKTNCTLLRLNEDQRKLEVLKARENEMKLKFIKEKAVKTFASPCQGT